MQPTFSSLDFLVLTLYFGIILGIAIRVALQKDRNAADHFLAGRHVGWFVIGILAFFTG